jgi:uncharacterized cupin superfamily protein
MPGVEYEHNIWNVELVDFGAGTRGARLDRIEGEPLGAALWELDPGASSGPYHFHHGTLELLIVLRGQPTLRTPEGERRLEEGDVVPFARGASGAHQVLNGSDAIVRYLMIGSHASPEIIEYVDSGRIAAMAKTQSQTGEPFLAFFRQEDAVEERE